MTIATSAGLPPDLPGMPTTDLLPRQIWWVGTVAATGAGIYLLAMRRETWAQALAIVLIGLPHVIGAPQPLENGLAGNPTTQIARPTTAAGMLLPEVVRRRDVGMVPQREVPRLVEQPPVMLQLLTHLDS